MITLEDIQQTRERIAPYVRRTPLVANETLTRELGAAVFLKHCSGTWFAGCGSAASM